MEDENDLHVKAFSDLLQFQSWWKIREKSSFISIVPGFIGLSSLGPVQWNRSSETIGSSVFQWDPLVPLEEGWLYTIIIFYWYYVRSW